MVCHIVAVWPYHRADKTLHHATVIVRDERGKKHVLTTVNDWIATRCLQLEKPSSTDAPPAKLVDVVWNADHEVLDVQEAQP